MKAALAGLAFAVLMEAAALPRTAPGSAVRYRLRTPSARSSVVSGFTLSNDGRWLAVHAEKSGAAAFDLWLLRPEAPERYILREGSGPVCEYRHPATLAPVLPSAVPLAQLLPATVAGSADLDYLGHRYTPAGSLREPEPPAVSCVVPLQPDLMIGPASNSRPKEDIRRWDGSDYEMVRLTRDDYRRLAEAGVSCVRTDDEQAQWAHDLGLFYWGAGEKLPFPEMLYRPQYLGPALYLDEPAVSTRDHVLRPRLAKDEVFRRSIRPRDALLAFERYYDEVLEKGSPARLQALAAKRPDIDLGSLVLVQNNLYSWETMISTAAWQLTRRPQVPAAFVFEPPGRVGARRTLPELNMSAGTQHAAGDTGALAGLVASFLRGAARLSGRDWGISIYGAVERADAPALLTRAYDLGATRFHFWDNYQLACVPFSEILALARHLRNHAANHPARDLNRLRQAAEVAILLPPGYDLGHTHMGRGNLWGLTELNLERRNAAGVPYRTVMSNFHLEAERCLRAGIAFDALWDLPGRRLTGYREVVRIREDGRVEVESSGRKEILAVPRRAAAKPGPPPRLTLAVDTAGLEVTAVARIVETAAPVYYTHGTDDTGVYRNAMVLWELYGPDDAGYRFLAPERMRPVVRASGAGRYDVEMRFRLDAPGAYRLRAATVDTAGRTRVAWQSINAGASPRTAPTALSAASGRGRAASPPPDSNQH